MQRPEVQVLERQSEFEVHVVPPHDGREMVSQLTQRPWTQVEEMQSLSEVQIELKQYSPDISSLQVEHSELMQVDVIQSVDIVHDRPLH
jgi:hypothetical protein